MHSLKNLRKILAFLTCTALSVGALAVMPASDKTAKTSALTLQEIDDLRKENDAKIADLESKINDLEGDKQYEEQQKAYLNEQVEIIQKNINLINAELNSIAEDISATEQNIADLDLDIQNQQESIDSNIELFKKRLCAMYINGSDSSASLVLGSSSFYDVMSRVQILNRIAEYDDKLINDIISEIEALEQSKSSLESEKLLLSMKLDNQNKRKEEKAAQLEVFNEKMQQTQYAIDQLAAQQAKYQIDKEALEANNSALAAEQDAILAEIKRQQEEAQRQWELNNRPANTGGAAYQGPSYIAPTVAASGFAWPVPGFSYISSYYGPRWGSFHYGIDVGDAGIMRAGVVASQAGTVVAVNNSCTHNTAKDYSCGCGGGYGNYVTISHDGTYSTLYGHLTQATVSVGQYVNQGDVVGTVGTTGWSTGAHLHFEIIQNGSRVNPLNFVSP